MKERENGGDPWGDRAPRLDRKPEIRMDPRSMTGTSPKTLLGILADGDPLDLALRGVLRRDEGGFLLAQRRLLLRTIARCAFAGFSYPPDAPIEPWIEARIDESIRDLLEEDEWGDRKQLPVVDPAHYELLTDVLGCAPEVARAIHVRFHELPRTVRTAYCAVIVRGDSAEEFARRTRRSPESVHSDVSKALSLILSVQDEPDQGGAS